jgi:deazaflavin-dependent oxidoreductase (nitroreductase family)
VNSLKKTSPSSSSKDNNLQKEQCLYLTTRGRKSGVPREIEIWFTHREGRFYLIAEYATSNWIRNLVACPQVEIRVAGNSFRAGARVFLPETELTRSIQQLSRDKYGWGDGLVVELTPENVELTSGEPGAET